MECDLGGSCEGGSCCAAPGGGLGCGGPEDCCGDNDCVGGKCCALPMGSCRTSGDCCADLLCADGLCLRPFEECGRDGEACCADDVCRSGLVCSRGVCATCGGSGELCCAPPTECDMGLTCTDGTCATSDPTCGGDGEPCCTGDRCDGALSCESGTCTMPTTACGYSDCGECTMHWPCGWCDGMGCLEGSSSGPDSGSCGDWAWLSSQCGGSDPCATSTDCALVHRARQLRLVRRRQRLPHRRELGPDGGQLRELELAELLVRRRLDVQRADGLRRVHGALPLRLVRRHGDLLRGQLVGPGHGELQRLVLAPLGVHGARSLRHLDELRHVHGARDLRLVRDERHLRHGHVLGSLGRLVRRLGLALLAVHVLDGPRLVHGGQRLLLRAELPRRDHLRRPLLPGGVGQLQRGRRLLRLHGLRGRELRLPRERPRVPRERRLLLRDLLVGALQLIGGCPSGEPNPPPGIDVRRARSLLSPMR